MSSFHPMIGRMCALVGMFTVGATVTAAGIYFIHPSALQATHPPADFRVDEALPPVIIYTSLPPHLLERKPKQAEPAPAPLIDVEPVPPALTSAPPRPLEITEVLEVQLRLRELSFDPGPLDGVVGARTTAAIAEYEDTRGYEVTGMPSRVLLERLRKEATKRTKAYPVETAKGP
jgi:hypothetical protein